MDETLKKFRLKKRRRKRELACVVACFVIGRDTHYTSFFSTRIYIYTHIYVSLRACIYAYVKNYFPPIVYFTSIFVIYAVISDYRDAE